NLMHVIERHFVSPIISAIGGRTRFAVPRSDAGSDAERTVIRGRNAGGYDGQNGGWRGRILSKVHRGQIEDHDRSTAVANEQGVAVRAYFESIWAGHWIHAVAAGSTALRAGKSTEVMVCTKARDEMERGPALPG